MSIENRVISVLQSAVRADSLPEGSDLSSPDVIHTGDGHLLDCNDAFTELVARSDLLGTHFSERCPTLFIQQKGDEISFEGANLSVKWDCLDVNELITVRPYDYKNPLIRFCSDIEISDIQRSTNLCQKYPRPVIRVIGTPLHDIYSDTAIDNKLRLPSKKKKVGCANGV